MRAIAEYEQKHTERSTNTEQLIENGTIQTIHRLQLTLLSFLFVFFSIDAVVVVNAVVVVAIVVVSSINRCHSFHSLELWACVSYYD